jgi:hypothetical protein
MIGQYLSNTNERATVSILQNILELNKAYIYQPRNQWKYPIPPTLLSLQIALSFCCCCYACAGDIKRLNEMRRRYQQGNNTPFSP